MRGTRYLIAAVLILGACGGKLPGGKGVPGGDKIPGGGVPGGLGGESGMVDPNTCGNYAGSEAGARLKAFLQAIVDLDKRAQETVAVVRTSCVMMGKELGMTDAEFPEGMSSNDVCAKVWAAYNDNMKVAVKSKAAFNITYKPAVCRINVNATAEMAAKCEGKATADVGATCSGTCRGKCDGQCSGSGAGKAGTGGSGGGASGDCNGECKGTCKGDCEGHADVKASGQCKAKAQASASADMQCTEAEFSVKLDAKLALDKTKADQTLKAMQAGFPKLLSLQARLRPLQAAVETTVMAAKELKDMGPKFVNSFKDQAMCISGQIAAAVNAATNIQANVSVSVEVSASASGSVGG